MSLEQVAWRKASSAVRAQRGWSGRADGRQSFHCPSEQCFFIAVFISDGLHDRFPHCGYKDMVTAEKRLITEGLRIRHLRLVFGTVWEGCTLALGRTMPGVNGRNHPCGLPAGQNRGPKPALAPYHYHCRSVRPRIGRRRLSSTAVIAGSGLSALQNDGQQCSAASKRAFRR